MFGGKQDVLWDRENSQLVVASSLFFLYLDWGGEGRGWAGKCPR